MSTTSAIESPCIQVCTLDPATQICIGCYRSIDEIAAWGGMSEVQRDATLQRLPTRRQRYAFGQAKHTMPAAASSAASRCVQCGEEFICGMSAGQGDCWCGSYPHLAPRAGMAGCLCPSCLAAATQTKVPKNG